MELKLDRNKTYGLALEGGGAKGAYQIGAWKALREAGIRFSAVSGTSVGALNGAMIVMDDLQKAEDVWNNIHFSQVMDVDDEEMRRLIASACPSFKLAAISVCGLTMRMPTFLPLMPTFFPLNPHRIISVSRYITIIIRLRSPLPRMGLILLHRRALSISSPPTSAPRSTV